MNNAGIDYLADIELCSMEIYHKVAEVNLFGMIRVTKAFLPIIRKTKGKMFKLKRKEFVIIMNKKVDKTNEGVLTAVPVSVKEETEHLVRFFISIGKTAYYVAKILIM